MFQHIRLSIVLGGILLSSTAFAQHPDLKKIDNLKNLLSITHGIKRIDCLNALGEEYWWPAKISSDSISKWANLAYNESVTINYQQGIAKSIMLFGVAEIYRKNLLSAEKYLRQALRKYETLESDFGLGWCNIWLGQSLFSQNDFDESLAHFKTAIGFLDNLGDWDGKGKAWAWMGAIYATFGNYDSSFYYCSKSLLIRQQMSDHVCVAASLTNMGQLYKVAGAYEVALDFYRQGYQYANTHGVEAYIVNWNYFEPVGSIFRLMNSPDSSYYYLKRALQTDSSSQMTRISFAETLMMKNEYDLALEIFLEPIDHFRKQNDKWDLMRVLMDVGNALERKKENKKALQFALESTSIARKASAKRVVLEGYLLLSKIYKNLQVHDSAYFFLHQYTSLKDSIVNNQFLWQLSNYKRKAEYKYQLGQLALLDKDNKAKEEQLKRDALLKWILIACLIIAALSGIIVYKNLALKRKNEKLENVHKQTKLQQHVSEVEMQALRAQMNPHFIFNCLSSINRFILKNETEAASNYLTKFSRLIRMVLTNSKKSFISLEDELEMLCLYLEMEKLRFKDSFDYSITFTNSIEAGNVFIPPLLLQPFAENAIWHGLMHKDGQGHLKIELSIDKKILTCNIIDNGVGRSKAAEYKSKSVEKEKSMGLQITTQRLALLNKDHKEQTFFDIEDIIDYDGKPAGTSVVLRMNYRDLAETLYDI